jgi:hypothetical protein
MLFGLDRNLAWNDHGLKCSEYMSDIVSLMKYTFEYYARIWRWLRPLRTLASPYNSDAVEALMSAHSNDVHGKSVHCPNAVSSIFFRHSCWRKSMVYIKTFCEWRIKTTNNSDTSNASHFYKEMSMIGVLIGRKKQLGPLGWVIVYLDSTWWFSNPLFIYSFLQYVEQSYVWEWDQRFWIAAMAFSAWWHRKRMVSQIYSPQMHHASKQLLPSKLWYQ